MCQSPFKTPSEDEATRGSSKRSDISLSELKSHNSPSSAWASVHGKVIDITEFSRRHPGGDIILLAAGKDATALVETYHPRGVPSVIISKLQIGTMHPDAIPSSFYNWDSDFYDVLKKRVVSRLDERNLPMRGGKEIWIKAVLILVGFWASLILMYRSEFKIACVWTVVMGIFAHFVGTCIQHDGNHGAFAKNPWINYWAGWTMDMIGASAFTWQFQHMLGHHPYTNLANADGEKRKMEGGDCLPFESDQESDPDVFSSFPLMRMHPVHEPAWFHKYQHLYAPCLFALMTLAKVFQQDIEVATLKRLYHIDAHCRYDSLINLTRFWGMKALSMVYMTILPCYFHGIGKGLFLFTLGHLTCGEVLATMFIVNHVIEGVSFAEKGEEVIKSHKDRPFTAHGSVPMEKTCAEAKNRSKESTLNEVPFNDWAAVQCQTSVNWSPGSWFWNHFSGGLSHQIEHHLFPSICHTNYVHIHDIVEETCSEYGVPYQAETNLFVAYGKMLNHLKFMGKLKAT